MIQGIGAYLDEGGLGPDNDVHIGVSHDGMVTELLIW